jgi:IMP dehydrogenase
VARVKRYESGVLRDPITVTPDTKVREVHRAVPQHGFSGFPVLQGKRGGGHRHQPRPALRDAPGRPGARDHDPARRLVYVREGASLDEGKALMHQHKLERVLVVNDAFELRGLMTVKDITKQTDFPNAARDAQGKLRVGAAVGVGDGTEERVELLVKAGVDALVVDTAHGHRPA